MKTEAVFKKTILAASIAMLAACGGSGGGNSASDGTSVGVVTGFGSIYVNGVEYETGGATVDIDGVSSVETELGIGDVVEIDGSVNADGTTGTANSVVATDELEGYVFDVSTLSTGSIIVMGQIVTITLDTVFSSDSIASIDLLANGDIVEVSGFSDGLGNITATRIETKNVDTDIELKGLVTGLNRTAQTFTIGGLTIAYSADVPANLANDLYVEVKQDGTLDAAAIADMIATNTMPASKVEVEEDGDMDVDGDENDEIKIQGIITNIDPIAKTFNFNGSPYTFDSVELEGDFDIATDLTDGMIITVEGTIDANGEFVLKEIELIRETTDEVSGNVTAVGETTVTVDNAGSEMTFTVNNDTRMIDESSVKLQYFSLLDVQLGNSVKIGYYEQVGTGIKIAAELKRL